MNMRKGGARRCQIKVIVFPLKGIADLDMKGVRLLRKGAQLLGPTDSKQAQKRRARMMLLKKDLFSHLHEVGTSDAQDKGAEG